jgi:glycerate dehydrogenase
MSIVVLDAYTLNPGDLSWDELEKLGPSTIHDRTPPEQVVTRALNAELVLTNKTVLSQEILSRLPRLRYIGVLATGYNVVDIEAARQRGIIVTNVPSYGTRSVAQMALAHLLNLAVRVGQHARGVAEGRWSANADWCYWDHPLVELDGRTVGIVGLGRIGRAMATGCLALGMKILAYDPQFQGEVPPEVELADLDRLFRTSDAVSLHCPLTRENWAMVDAARLAQMKATAFLINTSRGPLIDESALAEALNTGRIAGAGLDVLSIEPPPPDHPLLTAKNCFVTPHVAWATRAARQRLLDTAVENVRAFLGGRPVNVISG